MNLIKITPNFHAIFLSLFVCFGPFKAWAADTYDSSTSILSISSVAVGDILYTNVKATVKSVESVGATSVTDSYDTYNTTKNQLTIPVVSVGTNVYYNVVLTVGKVLSVGGSCSGVATCYSALASSSTSNQYYPAATFTTVLNRSYSASNLVRASSLTSRSRYMLSDSSSFSTSSKFLSIGSTFDATAGFTAESGLISNSSTYNTYLSKLFQAVSDTNGNFRFDSYLHPNNSLDCDTSDSNKLKFRNNFGKASVTYGYVTFSYDSQTNLVQAKKRYKYTYDKTSYAATYKEDTLFSAAGYYLKELNGSFQLVANASSGTNIYLYSSPISLGIPTDFNPSKVTYATNPAAAFGVNFLTTDYEGVSGFVYRKMASKMQAQVASVGTNADTKIAAEAMLSSIKTALASKGETLRYDTAVYSAFRDGLLATVLATDSVADLNPGKNLVPYVWFSNEQDSSGNYHPFMVVVTYGNHPFPHNLIDTVYPPTVGLNRATDPVGRFPSIGVGVRKFPMKDYGIVTSVTENTMKSTLLSGSRTPTATATVYNYASGGETGVLIDSTMLFPVYNNNLVASQSLAELSPWGCHIGSGSGGGGPHCHADGFETSPGTYLYNAEDYVGKTHPPLIGFTYDGLALFGKYRKTTDAALLGYTTTLDGFGGHNHGDIGYHMHAHTVENYVDSGTSTPHTLHVLTKGAFIGKTNSVPCFDWATTACSSATSDKYMYGK
jgi:hypothetical protein